MRYVVLTWHSLDLKKVRRSGYFNDEETAWVVASKYWQNPRVRLALVVAVPPKRLEDLLREDAEMPQRFTIPRTLTGNEPINPEQDPKTKRGWSSD
jgi:hypothetical protein